MTQNHNCIEVYIFNFFVFVFYLFFFKLFFLLPFLNLLFRGSLGWRGVLIACSLLVLPNMENKALNILLQNIRSMPKNFDNFNVYLETLSIKPMIICLTETWLNDRFNPSLFNLNDYHSPKVQIEKKRGGGVLIYASKNDFWNSQ